jgi:hypothetical protein
MLHRCMLRPFAVTKGESFPRLNNQLSLCDEDVLPHSALHSIFFMAIVRHTVGLHGAEMKMTVIGCVKKSYMWN